jgi:hypothetical protein
MVSGGLAEAFAGVARPVRLALAAAKRLQPCRDFL